MKTGEIGEREFLSSIQHLVHQAHGAKLQFNDDASDVPVGSNKHVVVNVDTFVSATDRLPEMTDAQVGRKTAVMALSDIVAKGATPIASMLSLCMPEDYEVSSASEIVRGFSQYCLKKDVPFVGGDMGLASDVVLTGVALGTAEPDLIVSRSGAGVDDVIAVTGRFGLTSVAFSILLDGLSAKSDLHRSAVQAAYKPEIYFGLVSSLAKIGAVSSSMDSSDGLGITLHTMASQSNLAFLVDDLPVARGVEHFARENQLDTLTLVMQGGEEFILVLTIPSNKWDDALTVARENHAHLTEIGTVVKGEGTKYESSEGHLDIPSKGYDNFRKWS